MSKNTKIAYIYALIDPRDNEIRYIGKTVSPKYRLSGHISESKKYTHYRAMWINSLLKENLKPIMRILKICPLSDFTKYESHYISLYRNKKLTNSDDTGQGNTGRKREIVERASKKNSKPVYQYDINGNFIREYKSVRNAAFLLKISHTQISRCCRGEYKHTNGLIFRYDRTLVNFIETPNAVKKSIIEVDIVGHKINEWVSIMDCSRSTGIDNGNLSRVCNNKLKSIKGRYFRFN